MSYPSIKPQKGSEIVADYLEKQIKSGQYAPGSKLPTVVELSQGFEVGRSTVREALSALKAKGYLDIRHGGGTYVNKTLPSDSNDPFYQAESFREVLEVRKYIEVGCASLAAKRHTEQDITELQAVLQHMESCLHDEHASEEADVRFHQLIARASHNSLLHQLAESMHSRMQETIGEFRRLWFYSERASAEQLLKEHRLLFEAIEARNEQLASERMMRHLIKVESTLVQRM